MAISTLNLDHKLYGVDSPKSFPLWMNASGKVLRQRLSRRVLRCVVRRRSAIAAI